MKKFLVVLMSVLMVISMAACGPKEPDKESYSFKVWCADKIVDLTKSQLDKFAADHPESFPCFSDCTRTAKP